MMRRLLFLLGLAMPSLLWSQTAPAPVASSAAPAANPSRLQQLEATYQVNLRSLDTPILRDYQRELERLKQNLNMQGRASDAAQVDAELNRMKKASTTTGILVYEPPKPPPPPPGDGPGPPMPKKRPDDPMGRLGPDTVVLAAKDAAQSSAPSSMPDAPRMPWYWAAPVGTIPICLQVPMRFGCSTPAPKSRPGASLTATINGLKINRPLPADLATSSDQSFRLLRLGQFTQDRDANAIPLTLLADATGTDPIWIRGVVVAHPKPRKPGSGMME